MAYLKIFDESANLLTSHTDLDEIQSALLETKVTIEKWQSFSNSKLVPNGLTEDEVLKLYDEEIARIKSQFNFKAVDLMSINPEFAKREDFNDLRNRFLKEHIHSDDEVRYFIEGSGLFTIHHQKKVFSILCSAGDFNSVPANTLHWFDMGNSPSFKCLRFFSDESGWVPVYSENSIAKHFPCLDEFDKLGSLS